MSDVWTVVWKESRVFASNRGSVLLGYGIIVLAFAVMMLLDAGPEIAEGDILRPLMVFSALAMILSSSQTARSFAGERENKTLAALLATRISDRDLFLGKALSIVLFTAGLLTVAGGLHVLAVNGMSRASGGGWVYYQARPERVPFLFLLPAAVAAFTSVVGVLISLKVRNVRGSYLLNLFSGTPALGIAYAAVALGPWGGSWGVALLVTLAVYAGLILVMTLFAVKRFRRETLVLET